MSDVGPYGVTQNPDAEAITADAMVGERVSPTIGDALAGSSAALFSTAPYEPPPPPPKPAYDRHVYDGRHPLCVATKANGTQCNQWQLTESQYCRWHQPEYERL